MEKLKKLMGLLTVAFLMALSPFIFFENSGTIVTTKKAEADVGTCCPGSGFCIVGGVVVPNAFSKEPGSDCGSTKTIR